MEEKHSNGNSVSEFAYEGTCKSVQLLCGIGFFVSIFIALSALSGSSEPTGWHAIIAIIGWPLTAFFLGGILALQIALVLARKDIRLPSRKW